MTRAWMLGVLVLALSVGGSGIVAASDHPIEGARLVVKRLNDGRERMVFISYDSTVPFPTPGDADDPTQPGASGAVFELFGLESVDDAAFVMPGGKGRQGWAMRRGRRGTKLRFFNPHAPEGLSPVRRLMIRKDFGMRIAAPEAGLALDGEQGAVAVRLTMGALRACSLFDEESVLRDVPGKFVAVEGSAEGLQDCSDASLLARAKGTTTTTTTSSTSTTATSSTTTTTLLDFTFGNDVEFPDASAHGSGFLSGFAIDVPVGATVTHLAVIAKAAGAQVMLGLYADVAGEPGALVAATPATPLAPGPVEIRIPPTPIAAGQYWLLATYDAPASVGIDLSDPGAVAKFVPHPFGLPLPGQIVFPQTFFGETYNYYLRAMP
jgi:hypothetical protein